MHASILTKDAYHLWDDFVSTHKYASIHQTSSWAHFQSNVPSRDKYWIIALFAGKNAEGKSISNKILAGTVLIKHRLPNSKYCWLYCPRGPLLSYDDQDLAKAQLKVLTAGIKKIAKQEKAIFLRADPLIEQPTAAATIPATQQHVANQDQTAAKLAATNQDQTAENHLQQPTTNAHLHSSNLFKSLHFHPSHLGFQPEDTLIIDLTKSQDEILNQMKPKGRYNIRLAEKKGVKIIEADPSNQALFTKQIESYWNILQETLTRDKFYGHGVSFYKNMIEKLSPIKNQLKHTMKDPARAFSKDTSLIAENLKKGFAKLYLAEASHLQSSPQESHPGHKQGHTGITGPLAALIITFHKDTAIYYYGASSNTNREFMAPYLLQWHAMMQAKSLGLTHYDLLGIAPPKPKSLFSKEDALGDPSHPWRGVTEFKRKFGGTYVHYLPAQELTLKTLPHLAYKFLKKLRKIFK